MSRGLGVRQRVVLAVLRGLDERSPGRWWSPADVIAAVTAERSAPIEPETAPDPDERLILSQIEGCRRFVDAGRLEYIEAMTLAERRLASLRAGREAARRAKVEVVERKARRLAAIRYPNQRRPVPRGGEAGNPSRVLAQLARRGLVERVVVRGPGSAVRIAPG